MNERRTSAVSLAWTGLKLALMAVLLIWMAASGRLDLQLTSRALDSPAALLGGAVLSWAGALGVYHRWRIILRAHAIELGHGPALRLTLIGLFFSMLLPGGAVSGDVVKACYVARGEGDKPSLVGSVVFDKLMSTYSMLVLAAAALAAGSLMALGRTHELLQTSFALRQVRFYTLIAFAGCTVVGLALASSRLAGSSPARLADRRLPLASVFRALHRILNRYRRNPRLVLIAFGWSVLCHLAACAGLWLLALSLGPETIFPAEFIVLAPLAALINAIPLTPGGLGVGELGFAGLFAIFGSAAGGELAVLYHVALYVLALTAGGTAFILSDTHRSYVTALPDPSVAPGSTNTPPVPICETAV